MRDEGVTSRSEETVPLVTAPGSPEAVAVGCCCPVLPDVSFRMGVEATGVGALAGEGHRDRPAGGGGAVGDHFDVAGEPPRLATAARAVLGLRESG